MTKSNYEVMSPETGGLIKMWTKGVPVEDAARKQLANDAVMATQSDLVKVVYTLKQVVCVKG